MMNIILNGRPLTDPARISMAAYRAHVRSGLIGCAHCRPPSPALRLASPLASSHVAPPAGLLRRDHGVELDACKQA